MKAPKNYYFVAVVVATVIANSAFATSIISFDDAVNMTDDALREQKEIVVTLDEVRSISKMDLDHVMTMAQNATLVLDCGDATEIEDNVLKFKSCDSNTTIQKIKVIGSNVTQIGHSFLSGCKGLIHVNLSSLSNVTQIGSEFLYGCSGLTSIDLSPFSNVIKIGYAFLKGCSGLTSIDLRGLSNVTEFVGGFIADCSGLTNIDLSPLSKVTDLGAGFLSNCSGLISIDLRPLSNVKEIGNYCIYQCNGLRNVDLSSLSNVTKIGYSFLCECENLTSVTIPQGWRFKKRIQSILPKCVQIIQQLNIIKQHS